MVLVIVLQRVGENSCNLKEVSGMGNAAATTLVPYDMLVAPGKILGLTVVIFAASGC